MATTSRKPTTEELLTGMLSDYQSRSGYVPRTTAENQARAQDEYKSYYDQLRLSAQQRQQQADLALQQQRAGLQDTYDQQREASARDYRQRYSQADRQMLSRGMQRSSYGAQVLANINQQGAEAQQRLWDAQGAAEGNIDAQRAQLAQQLGDQLLQYDASRAADVLKRTRELDDQEYERQQAQQQRNDQLGLQLASILRQAERDKISDEQFERQFGLSKQQAEAQIANMQWQQQYQTDRARAADEQAARQYALSEKELEAQLANQQWQRQYQEGRAKASDEQWAKQFGLSQQQLEAQLANQQWQREYQQARDAVSDAQWQQNYDFNAKKWADTLAEQLYQRQYQEGRDAVKDSQWAKEYGLKAASSTGAGAAAGTGGGSSADSKRSSGGSGGASNEGYVGSTFDSKEYAKSLAGIKSGVLKSNESPLTTFGSASAANAYYKSNGGNAGSSVPTPNTNYNPTSTAGLIDSLNNQQNGTYQPLIEYMKKYQNDKNKKNNGLIG